MSEHNSSNHTIFITLVRTPYGKTCARLLVESLRAFGGVMQHCPFWIFEPNPKKTTCLDMQNLGVNVMTIEAPEPIRSYLFGEKVYACAQAEALVPTNIQSVVWIDPGCLIVQPPLLYALDENYDAAFRPVHIRNVGSPITQPLDAFWAGIYEKVGVRDIAMTVESFVDGQRIRAHFNSHAFAINPAKGLMKRWLACFDELVSDQQFQSDTCQDDSHKVFLFQAVLSTVIASSIEVNRLRLLPPEYNYPYNLHDSIPTESRVMAFNDLVIFPYEDLSLNPQDVKNIAIHEPLKGWLTERVHDFPRGA